MYNIAFTGIIILGIVNLVELDEVSRITLQAVGVLWGSFFCSFAFVLPRLLEVGREKRAYQNTSSIYQSGVLSPTRRVGPDNNNNDVGGGTTPERTSRRKNSALRSKPPPSPSLDHSVSIITTMADRQGFSSTKTDLDPTKNGAEDQSQMKNSSVSRISFPFTTWETTVESNDDFRIDLSNMDTPSYIETRQNISGVSQIRFTSTSSSYTHTVGEALEEAAHPTN